MQKFAAQTQLNASLKEAHNENAIREAEAALRVAQNDLDRKHDLYKSNTVSESEYERAKLAAEHADLALQNSHYQKEIAAMKALVDEEAVKAADDLVERHRIVAPIQGNVSQVIREVGEWVNVGDVVTRLTRMDVLRVEGQIDGEQYNPDEIIGCPVTVRAWRARGQSVDFHGRVVHVSLRQTSGKKYQVRAEVENRQSNGHWLMHPGAQAAMTIHLDSR